MKLKFNSKEMHNFLSEVLGFQQYSLKEELSNQDYKSIREPLLNMKFMSDSIKGSAPFIGKFVDIFTANAEKDVSALSKAGGKPEEIAALKKILDSYAATVALLFDKGIVDRLNNAKAMDDSTVGQSLGAEAQNLINVLKTKMENYSSVLLKGAERASQKITTIKMDPNKYGFSPMAVRSLVNDVFNSKVGDFREGFKDAHSFLVNIGLKSASGNTIPPRNTPTPPPSQATARDAPTVAQKDISSRAFAPTAAPDASQASGQQDAFKADVAKFWMGLSPQDQQRLTGLKKILDKYKIVS